MGAEYTGNPNSNPKDAVRFLVGDTKSPFTFQDEEIVFALNNEANFWHAAALLCEKIVTLITSGVSSRSIGSLSESYSQQSLGFYQSQAKQYRMRGSGHQIPSFAEIDAMFEIGQFDNPEAAEGSMTDEVDD